MYLIRRLIKLILTEKQQEGLKIAINRYNNNENYTCIAGYAGTGKSTLIRFIISALQIPQDRVCYVAYTGKAAQVLRQKGCPNSMTAHKLLYDAKPMPNGSYKFEAKSNIGDYDIIVVDEISMLPKVMWDKLLSHNIYVLATGDPYQLPPIESGTDNHVLDNPHIFLTEIMRQAQESEIIRLSMHIREGKPLNTFQAIGKEVLIYRPEEVSIGMYEWADQILCGTNDKRNEINGIMRNIKGYGKEPCVGDKVISLRNHWEFFSKGKEPILLTNGTIGTIKSMTPKNLYVPHWIYGNPIPCLYTEMVGEEGEEFKKIPIDYNSLKNNEKTLTDNQEYRMMKYTKFEPPYEFAYAYAITCHKAQGSEWEKVLIFEERYPISREEHARWLYTAITRASKKVVIISPNKYY